MRPPIDIHTILNLTRSRPYLVGVDIGSATVKVAALRIADHPVLVFADAAELPPGCDDAYIADAIKKIIASHDAISKDAALTFTDDSLTIRRIEIPHVAQGEVADALRWQARDLVHFDIEKAVIDFETLAEIQKDDNSKFTELIFVAVSRDAIDRRVKIIKDAGLVPVAINAAPFGIEKVVKIHEDAACSGTVVIVDIGSRKTEVSVCKDRRLEFFRMIPVGSWHITDAMTKPLASRGDAPVFTAEEAERVKREAGIPYETLTFANGTLSIEVLSLIRAVLERLSREVRRSIDYYTATYGREDIGAVYLVGGGAQLKNLERYLADELKLPVKRMAVPAPITAASSAAGRYDGCAFIPLLGVILSYAKRPNLLPREYRAEKIEFIERISLRMTAVIAACILFVSFLFINLVVGDYRNRLAAVKSQKTVLIQVKDLQERAAEREAFLARVGVTDAPFEPIMKELSNAIPPRVVLESLDIDRQGKVMNMRGTVHEPKGVAQRTLTAFMEAMERSGYFRDAQLVSIQGKEGGKEEMATFDISCSLE